MYILRHICMYTQNTMKLRTSINVYTQTISITKYTNTCYKMFETYSLYIQHNY